MIPVTFFLTFFEQIQLVDLYEILKRPLRYDQCHREGGNILRSELFTVKPYTMLKKRANWYINKEGASQFE